MKIEKGPIQKIGQQEDLDLKSKEEKKQDLRERVVREMQEGVYSADSLTPEEQMLLMELREDDKQGDRYGYGN
ncbi:MAG: hypothetical protein V1649_02045 [Patescibacteria group bacterium]